MTLLHCSRPAAAKAIGVLEASDILHPLSAAKRNRTLPDDGAAVSMPATLA